MTFSFERLLAVLSTTPARWEQLTDAFPVAALRARPATDEWSALEVLQHMADLDRTVFPSRVRALLAGEDFPAFHPDADGTDLPDDADPALLVRTFAMLREQNLELVRSITTGDLARTATHAELGPVTLENLLSEWGGHDLMHLVQAEQALMQPFIAGCGPWRVYFKDHIVS